jgi:hypothetical protein
MSRVCGWHGKKNIYTNIHTHTHTHTHKKKKKRGKLEIKNTLDVYRRIAMKTVVWKGWRLVLKEAEEEESMVVEVLMMIGSSGDVEEKREGEDVCMYE